MRRNVEEMRMRIARKRRKRKRGHAVSRRMILSKKWQPRSWLATSTLLRLNQASGKERSLQRALRWRAWLTSKIHRRRQTRKDAGHTAQNCLGENAKWRNPPKWGKWMRRRVTWRVRGPNGGSSSKLEGEVLISWCRLVNSSLDFWKM